MPNWRGAWAKDDRPKARSTGTVGTPGFHRWSNQTCDRNGPLVDPKGETPHDRSRVYVTTIRNLARTYAARYNFGRMPGAVYNVLPLDDLEPDPDYEGFDVSFCSSARIVRVSEKRVQLSTTQQVMLYAAYEVWPDRTPMYDPQGYFLPSPELRADGVTDADLRRFGQWNDYAEITEAYLGAALSGELPVPSGLARMQAGATVPTPGLSGDASEVLRSVPPGFGHP
jgi:hypothetical protein